MVTSHTSHINPSPPRSEPLPTLPTAGLAISSEDVRSYGDPLQRLSIVHVSGSVTGACAGFPPHTQDARRGAFRRRPAYTERRFSVPVLSPKLSTGVPSISRTLMCRFASGVPVGYRT